VAAQLIDFCRGVAMVLQGESLKAKCYVTHNQSLGVLREKMVRNFIRHETPERYRVETGLIRNHQTGETSRQSDLLIHDSLTNPPLYRWEDFVVVHTGSAKAAVEVKSDLNEEEFKRFLGFQDSVTGLYDSSPIPIFGFALDGVKFKTFLEYVKGTVRENRKQLSDHIERDVNWPFCIAVQGQKYLGICVSGRSRFLAIDFSKAKSEDLRSEGVETAMFLHFYSSIFERGSVNLCSGSLFRWFNAIDVESGGKAWVDTEGNIHWDENITYP